MPAPSNAEVVNCQPVYSVISWLTEVLSGKTTETDEVLSPGVSSSEASAVDAIHATLALFGCSTESTPTVDSSQDSVAELKVISFQYQELSSGASIPSMPVSIVPYSEWTV